MTPFINNIVDQLKKHSQSLQKTSIFIDKPWVLIDENAEVQKLIFKKDKELIISKNGNASLGKWDFYLDANSILLDRGNDKTLCNSLYIDESILILKIDGTSNEHIILVNQNKIPDLDVSKYLNEVRRRRLNIQEWKLNDGRSLEIEIDPEVSYPKIGDKVYMNFKMPEDGKYQLYQQDKLFEIKNGKIKNKFYQKEYSTSESEKVIILQNVEYKYQVGDTVYFNEFKIGDKKIRISKNQLIHIEQGTITKIEHEDLSSKFLSLFNTIDPQVVNFFSFMLLCILGTLAIVLLFYLIINLC
jgi:hypothetical protein